jgi:hypothetical protein
MHPQTHTVMQSIQLHEFLFTGRFSSGERRRGRSVLAGHMLAG